MIEVSTIESCDVTVGEPSEAPGADEVGRSVRIRAFRGTLVTGSEAGPRLRWQYAPGASAAVTCGGQVPEAAVLQIARAVRFEDSRIQLPVTLSSLPTGYQVSSISESATEAWKTTNLTLLPLSDAMGPSVALRYRIPPVRTAAANSPAGRSEPVRGSVWSATGRARTPANGLTPSPAAPDTVQATIRLATDIDDRTTCFDATALPGR